MLIIVITSYSIHYTKLYDEVRLKERVSARKFERPKLNNAQKSCAGMRKRMTTKNIMIVGVGGQGTLLTSRILGGITIHAGYDVKLSEVHGMAQRGGSVVTFVRYGEKVAEPIVEEGQADVLIAFERLEALRYAHYLKKDGVLICNDQRIDPMPVVIGRITSYNVCYTKLLRF